MTVLPTSFQNGPAVFLSIKVNTPSTPPFFFFFVMLAGNTIIRTHTAED